MKEMRLLCIDPATDGEMLLTSASYNEATFWLNDKVEKEFGGVVDVDVADIKIGGKGVVLISLVTGRGLKKFLYDEERQYLLIAPKEVAA